MIGRVNVDVSQRAVKVVNRWCFAIFMLAIAGTAFGKPMVLSSIKPLSLIVQEVAGDKVQVETLLPPSASPHDYPLKPSDYQRIKKADLVIWIGEDLESFLHKPITGLEAGRVLTASQIPNLFWPPEEADEGGGHHHLKDPHLWLDPRNAAIVAKSVASRLIKLDPVNTKTYQTNALLFVVKMKELDAKITESMRKLAGKGFAVYHEGYAHFVAHYGLKQLEFVTFTPEQKPGARHLHQLREILAREGKCLFLEPYNDSTLALGIAKDLHLKTATLDALGALQVDTYSELLARLAESFSVCLAN